MIQLIHSNMLYASNILTSHLILKAKKLLEKAVFS